MPSHPAVRVYFMEDPDWVGFSTDTTDGVALVHGRLEDVNGRLTLTRLEFQTRQAAEHGGITSSTLRAVRLDAVLGVARGEVLRAQAVATAQASAPIHPGSESLVRDWRARIERLALAAVEQKATGKRGYGDDFYRLVALEYVALTERGEGGRGALQRLAEVMASRMHERTPRPRDNIRDWVAEARRRGFLTPGEPGRGGGGPGPRLYARESE